MTKMKSAKQRRHEEEEAVRRGDIEPREMVTPMLRKALSKQGGCGLGVWFDRKLCVCCDLWQGIVLWGLILASSSAVGPSPCLGGVAGVTNTHFMASRATAAWKPHPVWPAPTSVCSAGGMLVGVGVADPTPFLYLSAAVAIGTTPTQWAQSGDGRWTTLKPSYRGPLTTTTRWSSSSKVIL